MKQYHLTPKNLGDIIENKFIPQLEKAIQRDLLNQSRKVLDQDAEIGVGVSEKTPKSGSKNEDEDEDPKNAKSLIDDEASEDEIESDGEQDDGDVTSSKKREKHKQLSTYEEEGSDIEQSDEESEEVVDENGASREQRITETAKYVSAFKFDKMNGEWCEISFIFNADTKKILMAALCETVCEKVVIHEVKGIQRCFPQPNENENDKSVHFLMFIVGQSWNRRMQS
jgi:DNA-directed RNA polymerase I subunit RPA1